MNRDDIIRMAREAGIGTALTHNGGEHRVWIEGADWHDELEHFAALVAESERQWFAQIISRIEMPALTRELILDVLKARTRA